MWINTMNIDLYLAGIAVSVFLARLNGLQVNQVGRTWEVSY